MISRRAALKPQPLWGAVTAVVFYPANSQRKMRKTVFSARILAGFTGKFYSFFPGRQIDNQKVKS
jgi:hypothetical protein